MPPDRGLGWLRTLALVALLLFPALQTLSLYAAAGVEDLTFVLLTCLAALLALVAAVVRFWRGGAHERRSAWIAVALALWIGGSVTSAVEGTVSGAGRIAWSVLLFTLFDVPLLLLASANRTSHVSRAHYYIDAMLVLVLAYASWVFNADMVAQSHRDPGFSNDVILRNYTIASVLLAVVYVMRTLGSESWNEKAFFAIMAEFLTANLITATLFNLAGTSTSSFALRVIAYALMIPPFCVLAYRLASPLPPHDRLPVMGPGTRTILLSVSPSLIMLRIITLVADVFRTRPLLSACMLTVAGVCYMVRNILTQAWLMRSRDALAASEQALRNLALTDALTGIGNRRFFDDRLDVEWERAHRSASPVAVLMLDVDLFKAYNDALGHEAGDACLRDVAATLSGALPRAGDVVARYGGEEFAILLPMTDAAGAYQVGLRLREAVEALDRPHTTSPHGRITVSVGVDAHVPAGDDLYQWVLASADRALYLAKARGRNRVERGTYAETGPESVRAEARAEARAGPDSQRGADRDDDL